MNKTENKQVIFVIGPTAVGKSEFAVSLALEEDGEIVSADSMQVYRGLDLGTAKPSMEARKGVPHHMLDIADPREDYSAAAYSRAAQAVIADIQARGKRPVVCGGSGLYIHSLLYELDFSGGEGDMALRRELEKEAEEKGCEYLFSRLLEIDPAAASYVHPNNVKRVIRAIERAMGDVENEGIRDFDGTFSGRRRYETRIIRLTADREELYGRIERRAEGFFANGLVNEVRRLLEAGVPREGTAMQGIGYKEVASMLDGCYDEEEALRLVKQNTRRYAKRQETWFKRYADAELLLKS